MFETTENQPKRLLFSRWLLLPVCATLSSGTHTDCMQCTMSEWNLAQPQTENRKRQQQQRRRRKQKFKLKILNTHSAVDAHARSDDSRVLFDFLLKEKKERKKNWNVVQCANKTIQYMHEVTKSLVYFKVVGYSTEIRLNKLLFY